MIFQSENIEQTFNQYLFPFVTSKLQDKVRKYTREYDQFLKVTKVISILEEKYSYPYGIKYVEAQREYDIDVSVVSEI